MEHHLDPHQSREHEPTDYENILGDGLERAYASGVHDIEGVCARLNESGVPAPDGKTWTPDLFEREMQRRGA